MPLFICQGCGAEHGSWSGKCPNCGVSETIQLKQQADRLLEKVIKGKYKIIRKLGQGGMGAVYLAEQMGIGHRVALKFLKAELSTDAEIARRFLNEAKSYARVAHPNAVTLHDFGQDEDGNLFIAMEYCDGVDLKKVLQEQKRLPLPDAIDITLQVADVLANAHSRGVVHRDLKPENIMLRRGMRGTHVKVLDFGIARLMNDGTKLTMAGAIAGTPRYMSPEQVDGTVEVDHRADVYAIGILLYEMLTGVQPFDGNTIAEILRKQVLAPMPRLVDVSPDLDFPEVEAVLQKATQKNRDNRFPDMTALAAQLASAMPTQAGRPVGISTGMNTGLSPGMNTEAVPALQKSGAADDGTQNTMLRANTQTAATPFPTRGGDSVATQLSANPGPHNLSLGAISPSGNNPSVGSESIVVAPKSNGPVIGAVVVALLLLGGVGYAMFGQKKADDPVLPPPKPHPEIVVAPEPPKPPDAPKQPDPPPGDGPTPEEVSRGRDLLARAKTDFEHGDLDGAIVYLDDVPAKAPARPDADQLAATIAKIRQDLLAAGRLKASGNCDSAIRLYEGVVRLNPRLQEAQAGLSACRAGALPTTME